MEAISQECISSLKQGSLSAYKKVYKVCYIKVKYYAYHYLLDIHEANDLAQDVFLKLWEQRERLDPEKSLIQYLLIITRNKCLDRLKRKIHEKNFISSKIRNELILNYHALNDFSSERLIYIELSGKIRDTMEILPEKVKEAFYLSRFQNLNYIEIARIQNVSTKTVEYRITQALKVFRCGLKEYTNL